jgi:hypothetical protein
VNYLQKLPKYAFADEEITWVVKSDLELIYEWLDECEANSDQKQGNDPLSGGVGDQEKGNGLSSGGVDKEQGNGPSSEEI